MKHCISAGTGNDLQDGLWLMLSLHMAGDTLHIAYRLSVGQFLYNRLSTLILAAPMHSKLVNRYAFQEVAMPLCSCITQ